MTDKQTVDFPKPEETVKDWADRWLNERTSHTPLTSEEHDKVAAMVAALLNQIDNPPHPAKRHEPGVYVLSNQDDNSELDRILTAEEYELLKSTLKKINGTNWHYGSSNKSFLLRQIGTALKLLRNDANDAIVSRKSFQEDVLLYLRSIALMLTSVGTAGTHAEKEARLRGVIGLIESAIQNIRDDRQHFLGRYCSNPDLFRSDYPEREYLQKIRELESKLQKLDPDGTKSDILPATETYSDIPF